MRLASVHFNRSCAHHRKTITSEGKCKDEIVHALQEDDVVRVCTWNTGQEATRARNLCLRFALPCLLSKHTVSVWRSRHCKWPPFRSASDVAVTYLCSRRSTTLWFRISSGGSSADRDGCRWKNLASVESAQGLRRDGTPLLSMTSQREPACRSSHWASEND